MNEKRQAQNMMDCIKQLYATNHFIFVKTSKCVASRDQKSTLENSHYDYKVRLVWIEEDGIDVLADLLALSYEACDKMANNYYHDIKHPDETKSFNAMYSFFNSNQP